MKAFLSSRELWRIVTWHIGQTSCASATQAIVDHDGVSIRATERQRRRVKRERGRR